jgi:DNA invertase Pin-like site-specific DNA recombinase
MKPATPKIQRCAIYTRVSTDQGLEQEFNSLHAQREAAQAYIKSQAHEGWKLIRDHYDDGGFSGGSMERPALQKLLADIRERRIDVVVVYKVDRLTRSLTDFAKLVELFDEHGVSFVSVTQSFNTTTSMGRLTLNVLLSFAQFEREVTGERIRDKIAASKKKGIWVGGVVPLGYEVRDKKLLVNDDEARTIRMIFERYLALGSLPALQRELRTQGIVTRRRTLSSGKVIGGVSLTNGPLGYMLRNRVYLGEIKHRDHSYPGEHQPILDPALFDQVQARLDENRRGRRLKNEHSRALLLGKLHDDRGNRMTPSYAIKKGVRYRYYVSCVLAQGRKDEAGSVSRIAASEIETIVMDALAALVPASEEPAESDRHSPATSEDRPPRITPERVEGRPEQLSDKASIERYVDRIIVGARSIEVRFVDGAEAAAQSGSITIPWQPVPFRRKRELIQPADGARPIRAEAQGRLLAAIARGRSWLEEISSDQATRLELIAAREGLPERSARSILSLAFLAPDIVKATVNGTLPRGFGVSRLIDLPANWAEQRRGLGLSARS